MSITVGLDIGSDAVRAAVVETSKSGAVLRRFAEMPLAPGTGRGRRRRRRGRRHRGRGRPVEASPPSPQARRGGHRQSAGDRPPGGRPAPRGRRADGGPALPGPGCHPHPGRRGRARLRPPRGVHHPRRRPDAVDPRRGRAARDGRGPGADRHQRRLECAFHRSPGVRAGAGGVWLRPARRRLRTPGTPRHRRLDVAGGDRAQRDHSLRPHPPHRRGALHRDADDRDVVEPRGRRGDEAPVGVAAQGTPEGDERRRSRGAS